jgi:undecaprenyl-diphosphatase
MMRLLLLSLLFCLPTRARPDIPVGEAAILGLVEGLTEYLPVSSTGHLLLTQRLLGHGAEAESRVAADAFAIVIQGGAILAVIGLYWPFCRRMLRGVCGRDPGGLRLALNLALALVPAAVVGVLFDDRIEAVLFGLYPIAFAWLAGGLVILLVARGWTGAGDSDPAAVLDALTPRQALLIGLCQCVAVWPGVSRSLATILGGRAVGLPLRASVVFSFLLGGLTLTAATALKGLQHHRTLLEHVGGAALCTGLLVAFVSAVVSVRWMVGYLNRGGLAIFGWYRLALGLAVLGALWAGKIPH